MASRYPTIEVVDYCYNPVHVVDNDKDIIVPCGKCDGCLLHKANEWSMRCGMEIEDTPVTIFGSLTYSNKYLPKLGRIDSVELLKYDSPCKDGCYDLVAKDSHVWISDHPYNIRFNGVRDVPREDGIVINRNYSSIGVKNWNNKHFPIINYASKRDIQLWLKLLRKDLENNGIYKDKRVLERGLFRYFIISEIGPTTLRAHYHFLIFCQSQEVASYLLEGSLYKNWQMCLPERFFPYCHICDSGARGYVTQYLTCFADLPKVYRENKEIRPFRLSSKSPAIGYVGQIKEKIYQDVERGIIKYSRPVRRLELNSILEYPKNYTSTLFPKCYQFSKISDSRRFAVYACLYREVRELGQSYFVVLSRLSQVLNPQDFMATSVCYRFCKEYVDSPMYYYYLLDMYWYKVEMEHLKSFYESQEEIDYKENPQKIFEYYPNIEVCCCSDVPNYGALLSLSEMGIDISYLIGNKDFFKYVRSFIAAKNEDYRREVSDIIKGMVKVAKFNEVTGNAPTSF